MDFGHCGKVEEVASEDVRVSVRHDLRKGGQAHKGCLKHLGATGSMQFFADLSSETIGPIDGEIDNPEPTRPVVVVVSVAGVDVEARAETPAGNEHESAPGQSTIEEDQDQEQPDTEGEGEEESGLTGGSGLGNTPTIVVVAGDPTRSGRVVADWLPACGMKLVAWVGPFAEAEYTAGDETSEPEELDCCIEGVRRVEVGHSQNGDNAGKLKDWWEQQEPENIQRLILVGRADREPISNDFHFSNFALAQSRADWVKKQLAVTDVESDGLHVLSIPGGPATPHKVDPCDRVVEIHMCSGPAGMIKTDVETGGVEKQEQREAAGGVEEVP